MLGGNKKKSKKFLKKKFKKNGGVLPWKKDPVSIQIYEYDMYVYNICA